MKTSNAILPEFRRIEAPELRCPNCHGVGLERFYRVTGVPVHSLNLVPNAEVALDYPRGKIDLACCPRCGFITNAAFAEVEQSMDEYEESQGFSPTFVAFAERVAKRLVSEYDLGTKTVLEIGCGKGEFLAALVEHGAARGIGIDPAFVHGRLETSASDRLTFHAELFDERSPDFEADFICCRHTLEHIPDTLAFLKMIRAHIGDRPNVHLFIDVPEVGRILREGAYWDIFHEHMSYFSKPVLESLLRRAGFELVEHWLDFNDQYLLMVGRASDGEELVSTAFSEEVELLLGAVRDFRNTARTAICRWHETISTGPSSRRRIAIWGSGSKCVGFLSVLGAPTTDEIGCVVDINPHRQGKYMPGLHQPIVAPDELMKYQPDLVIVMNPIYVEEITKDLHAMGLRPEIVTA